MKKIVCVLLMLALMLSTALAAEWPEGRSPAQPYANVPSVDLNTSIGHILMYPRGKLGVEHFCDVLMIYLPREDIKLGTGSLQLYRGEELVETVSFANPQQVLLRSLTEEEMNNLLWGSGVCIEIWLSKSLKLSENYYVLMDENCFTNTTGSLVSRSITSPEAWVVNVGGGYGINELYYTQGMVMSDAEKAARQEAETLAALNAGLAPTATAAPAADGPVLTADEPEPSAAPAAAVAAAPAAAAGAIKVRPAVGDRIDFDLVLVGNAASAVVFSDNNSVSFETPEYTQSGHVTGQVVGDDLFWGVVFLDADGNVLDVEYLGR